MKLDLKNDLAPVGFFFDLFSSELFKIPILPIPLRIDRLFNMQPIYIIRPDFVKILNFLEKNSKTLNFKNFYTYGFQNFINYAKKQHININNEELQNNQIIEWFNIVNNNQLNFDILKNEFTYLILEYLKTYVYLSDKQILENEIIEEKFLEYCSNVVVYFREKLEKNIIKIKVENELIEDSLYFKKRGKIFPKIVKFKLKKENKTIKFVPYLIFEDILDTFYYNGKLIKVKSKELINLNFLEKNDIINKRSATNLSIKKIIKDNIFEKIDIKDLLI